MGAKHFQNSETPASTLNVWMTPPASGWHRKSRGAFVSAELYWPLIVTVFGLFLLLISIFLTPFAKNFSTELLFAQGLIVVTIVICLITIVSKVQQNLLTPLTHLRFWAMRMRGGHLLARIPTPQRGEFAELARDINLLSDELQNLTRSMEQQVIEQTEKATQKSRSLLVLYEIATAINNSRNLDELLNFVLGVIKTLVNARAASVRLTTEDNQLRLVSSIGLEREIVEREQLMPMNVCRCGQAATEGTLKCQDFKSCSKTIAHPVFGNGPGKTVAVPLNYRGKTLGIYNLFVDDANILQNEELSELLTSIGQHLGVAVVKAQLESDARRLALMEERNLISRELHDSLAQTLASSRIQLHMIAENVEATGDFVLEQSVTRLQNALEKANSDLRELLSHFRTPMDARGLVPAIIDISRQFERDTGISVYFQDESKGFTLTPDAEVQVLHIVLEALSNVRRHSGASHVRILIRMQERHQWYVLIEDDGQGIRSNTDASKPGEHIGLSIMKERAQYLGGTVQIESEIDEGTRIELTFNANAEKSDSYLLHVEQQIPKKVHPVESVI